MKALVKGLFGSMYGQWFRYTLMKRDRWMVKAFNLPLLDKEEMGRIREVWPWIHPNNSDLIWARMYKKVHGFDPFFITDWHLHFILKQTNPYQQAVSLQNKAMADVYFPEIPFPKNHLKNIRGIFWHDGEMMDCRGAINYLLENGISDFIIKPSVESGCGRGVRRVRLSPVADPSGFVQGLFDSYGKDFVVQEVLKQHPSISSFNDTSINSCRVTSLFIDGIFSCSTILKVGKSGSEVDNWHSSYLVGVDENGVIRDRGYDNKLNAVSHSDNGLAFGGRMLPCFREMISKIRAWHIKYFPNIGIIGWDAIVDENSQVKVIEINTDTPGVLGEQFCSGTFFKPYNKTINSLIKR